MRRIGLVGAVVVVGFLALVATAPSRDASAPDWLEPMFDAGRSSILDNVDLIEPGSPLVLVSAHCRSDGAVRLIYENRWLWLIPRQYFTQAPPGWTSGSMGGGTIDASDEWPGGHSEVSCADRPPTSLPQHCVSDGFSIGYPEGWWVHPRDAELRIDRCSFFAAEPFVAVREDDDFGVSGAQVSVWAGSGCRGSFDVAIAERKLLIDGRRAFRTELERGEGRPEPRALQYLVWVAGGIPCETSRWLVARTESDDPGDHAENRRVLDLMVQSLDLDQPRH